MKALKALIFILFFCNGLSTSTARECQTNAGNDCTDKLSDKTQR